MSATPGKPTPTRANGSITKDHATLLQAAALVANKPSMKATTAIRQTGIEGASQVR